MFKVGDFVTITPETLKVLGLSYVVLPNNIFIIVKAMPDSDKRGGFHLSDVLTLEPLGYKGSNVPIIVFSEELVRV